MSALQFLPAPADKTAKTTPDRTSDRTAPDKTAPDKKTAKTAAELLESPHLWRAKALSQQQNPTEERISTGFAALDEHLPDRGWPASGLCELLLETAGSGELRLLAPLLEHASREQRWIAWINPPFIPYAPALQSLGIDTDKILLIHPKSHQDALWAIERVSRSGTCSLVLGWLNDDSLANTHIRRLQLAAKNSGTNTWLFRHDRTHSQASMAELRLRLRPTGPDRLQVNVLKRRGGWPIEGINLQLPHLAQIRSQQELQQQLLLWKQWRADPASRSASLPSFVVLPAADSAAAVQTHPVH